MSEVAALDARMTRLEDQVTAGFNRIETLMRQEINDLKIEQINQLRKEQERLGDDQRRLWDRLVAIELRESQRVARDRTLGSIGHFLSGALGALITWAATWFSGAPPHH